jgi:hypothetical protein
MTTRRLKSDFILRLYLYTYNRLKSLRIVLVIARAFYIRLYKTAASYGQTLYSGIYKGKLTLYKRYTNIVQTWSERCTKYIKRLYKTAANSAKRLYKAWTKGGQTLYIFQNGCSTKHHPRISLIQNFPQITLSSYPPLCSKYNDFRYKTKLPRDRGSSCSVSTSGRSVIARVSLMGAWTSASQDTYFPLCVLSRMSRREKACTLLPSLLYHKYRIPQKLWK